MWQIINVFISSIFIALGVFLFGKIVIDEEVKISKSEFILSFIILVILTEIIYLNYDGTIKSILMMIIDISFYSYIFKNNINKSILTNVMYAIVIIIPDLLEFFFVTKILKMDLNFLYNNYAGSIISNIIVLILFVIVTKRIKKVLSKIASYKLENNKKIIVLSFFTFISTLMFFYTLINEYRKNDNIYIYLIAMIVLISVLSSLIKQTINNYKLTSEYDKLLEFMTTYENEIEKQRILRHETKNEFLIIKGKIHDKEKDKEIINYIDEILTEKIEVKQEEYAKFGYLPANGIKGLCYLKTQEAQDKKINTSINISKRIKNSSIYNLNIKEQRNLGKILGVILDNAIEASVESEDKNMGIEAYLIKGECQIIISNSYSNDNLNKTSDNKLSNKGKNRGHGLLLVKSIINSNKLFGLETDITDKLYIQKITIKKVNS